MSLFYKRRMSVAAWLGGVVLSACGHAAPPAPAPAPAPAAPAPAIAAAPPAQWVALALGGAPVGRSHERTEWLADGGVVSHMTTELRIGRLGKVVEVAAEVALDEDAAGRLRSVHSQVRLSRQVTTTDVTFQPGSASVRESAGGATHARTVALAEPLIGPAAIRRLLASKLRRTGDTADYATWSADLSAPSHVRCAVEAVERIVIDGVATPVVRVHVTPDAGPPHTAWLDASGRELRTQSEMPLGTMIATATRGEPQLSSGDVPADTFRQTLIRSNVRLPGPRALDKLVVRLVSDAGPGALDELVSADERVTARGARGAELDIAIDRVAVPPDGVAEGSAGAEFLAAGAIIDPSDPGVRAIAREVVAGAPDRWDRARRLTRWVSDHMTFDAGIAFAPAPELARDRHGTCAGYAVLLASLLRAAEIPARLDLGLVYVHGVFGGHAWVEAYVRGRWIPLDAALPSDGPADAARIAFTRGALADGPGAMIAAFSKRLLGARLAVVGYAPAGRALVRVDPAAHPYVIDGARYRNPGLGLSITAPSGYRFTEMDAVWPDRTLVALEGQGTRLVITENAVPPGRGPARAEADALELASEAACEPGVLAGRRGCAAHRAGAAGLALADGASLLVVQAKGPDARALIDAVAASARLDASLR